MTFKKGLTLFMTAAVFSFVFGKEVLFVNESPKKVVPVMVVHSQPKSITLSEKELACVSDMAYHEARGEGIRGISAVIHVTLNRMDSNKFPSNACSVVYQKIDGKCQYAWVCEKRGNVAKFRKSKEYSDIVLLTKTISSVPNRKAVDPTKGSLYYKKAGSQSKFFREKLVLKVAIGQHRFYKEA